MDSTYTEDRTNAPEGPVGGGERMHGCCAPLQQRRYGEWVQTRSWTCASSWPMPPSFLSLPTLSQVYRTDLYSSQHESFRLADSPSNKENKSESKVPLLRVGVDCILIAILPLVSEWLTFLPHLEAAEIKQELASCPSPFARHFGFLRARATFGLLVMTRSESPHCAPHPHY